MLDLSRRGFLTGLTIALAAPMIAKAEFLMPVKNIIREEMYSLDIEQNTLGLFTNRRTSCYIIDEISWFPKHPNMVPIGNGYGYMIDNLGGSNA